MGPGHDLAVELSAVVIERHVEELRAHPRGLSRRALAAEHAADIGKARHAKRRPAEQSGGENVERDRDHQFAIEADRRVHGERRPRLVWGRRWL